MLEIGENAQKTEEQRQHVSALCHPRHRLDAQRVNREEQRRHRGRRVERSLVGMRRNAKQAPGMKALWDAVVSAATQAAIDAIAQRIAYQADQFQPVSR